jgi:hypothetical protein
MRSLVVALSAMLVVGGAGALLQPGDDRAVAGTPANEVRVDRATLACPDPRSRETYPVDVHLLTPENAASRREGRTVVSELQPQGGSELLDTNRVGRPEALAMKRTDAPALMVDASGGLAAGIVAEQQSTITSGQMRGLAAGECPRPGNEFWFVGGGSEVGHRTSVLLTNPDASPAQVEVGVYGTDGRIETSADEGVVVPARGQQVLRLDAVASGSEVTAVHVLATAGRVAPAVFDTQVDGLVPRGTDWVPLAGEPGRRLLLPGAPAGDGKRLLHLFVPGRSDAVAELTLVTPGRAFAPTGHEVIDVPAGRVTTVDLTKALAGEAAALQLRSDVPLLAGAELRTGSAGGTSEVAYTAATPALDGPTSSVGIPSGGGRSAGLVLTAPESASKVRIDTVSAESKKPRTRTVRVEARSTKWVKLSGPAPRYGVVLSVSGGPVHAARVIAQEDVDGPLLTVLPMRSAPSLVTVPDVTADLSTGFQLGGAD